MRIAIDGRAASHPQAGGFKTYVSNLLRHIPQIDSESEYIVYTDRAVAWQLPPNVVVKVLPTRAPIIGIPLREQVGLPRALVHDRVTIAHCPAATAPVWAPCPIVVTIYDALGWQRPDFRGIDWRATPKRVAMYIYERLVVQAVSSRVARILTMSQHSKRDLIEKTHLGADRFVVTYGAASRTFRRLGRTDLDMARFALGTNKPFVLTISSASPRKNTASVLKAYAELRTNLRESHNLVVVVTHDLWQTKLLSQARSLGIADKVVFVKAPTDEDLCRLYNLASLFVFPSFYEGFGLPPLEAMACGTPVIASNTSSLPEVLGDAALLVNPASIDEIAEGMARVLDDSLFATELIQKGLANSQRFSWSKCAAETVNVYREVAASHYMIA